MSGTLQQFLGGLEILDSVGAGGLQVFGLRSSRASSASYLTLDETLQSGELEVEEVDARGRVPELSVSNQGASPVLLTVGEELLGAKQNRVLNVTLMVGARSRLRVPVSCVEAGRWAYSSEKFRSGFTSSHQALRSQLAMQASASYQRRGVPSSDQQAVWGEVSRKLRDMGSRSGSAALHQVYEDQSARLQDIFDELRPPAGCCGVAFASRGRLMGIEVFDQPATLGKLWKKLLRAYAIDVLEDPEVGPPVDRAVVQSCLEAASSSKGEEYPSPGIGTDVRFESAEFVGAGLLVEEQPVHAHIFSRPKDSSPSWPPPPWVAASSRGSERSRSRRRSRSGGSPAGGSGSRTTSGFPLPFPRPPERPRRSGALRWLLELLRHRPSR